MSVSYGDKSLSSLRSLVAVMDRELAAMTPASSHELRGAWEAMVKVLALGPEPQLRECPTCHAMGMRAASKCMGCWSSLTPLPPLPAAAPAND